MSSREMFIDEAVHIGDRLSNEAVWYRGRCTWITRKVPYQSQTPDTAVPSLMNLNPSVYSGTAGMSLYLSRLYQFSGDELHRRTAVGAMEHALQHATRVDDSELGQIGGTWRNGFYLGTLGIAWASHQVGKSLEDHDMVQRSHRLIHWLTERVNQTKESDVIFGSGGGIPALLSMAKDGVESADRLADALGDHLLDTAKKTEEGWSWVGLPYLPDPEARGLTGFSHGTAGIAYALAMLDKARGGDRYAEAVDGALAYEAAAYQPEKKNWNNYQGKPNKDGVYPGGNSWCHGAPGIGLGRVLMQDLVSHDVRKDAMAARETTQGFVNHMLDDTGFDFMLCHGVAGNAETLWLVEEGLGDETAHGRAQDIAKYGIERFGHGARERWGNIIEWPTGVSSGTYPPLLTGVAGIGHYMLRVAEPTKVPTVLVPGA